MLYFSYSLPLGRRLMALNLISAGATATGITRGKS
ncbi:hypothetical protein AF71_00013840 [Rhizobium sp. 57MFTsu3.2]|nr:hypothetical protein [Rhizobium sp. 57MFTsu3.2]